MSAAIPRRKNSPPQRRKPRIGFALLALAGCFISACTTLRPVESGNTVRLKNMAVLIDEVKAFGKSLGIEPTPALTRTAQESQPLSMLWLWLQRAGTLALDRPIDLRLAIGFGAEKEQLRIDQVYRVDGYSVYYRQGNEFADSRSVATIGFSAEPRVRQVMVVLHEDLHGDANFALPWEVEEGLVTPLGSLAAVAFFKHEGDQAALQNALTALSEERQLSRELNSLAAEAEQIFATLPVDEAKQKILERLAAYPIYQGQFERQIRGQHPPTVLEAKISHDLVYYRFFDRVAALAEQAPSLKALIADLKQVPADATIKSTEQFLRDLSARYTVVSG